MGSKRRATSFLGDVVPSKRKTTQATKDAEGIIQAGEKITLTTNNGQISTPQEKADGTYTATYTASTKALQVIITAKARNGKTGTLKLALTERPKVTPTFTVSSLKPELTGNPGGTISYLVKLEGKDKFADTVTLFATDLPKGIQATFDPKEVTM